MKKLLMVLCVTAFGLGAVAQAQVMPANGVKRMEVKASKWKMADLSQSSEFGTTQGQLLATDRYDTLHWHDEYISEECDGYFSMVEYRQDIFSDDVVPSPMGGSYNGTGEIGTTFQTNDNLYSTYAKINLNTEWVVGAVAFVYRRGNPAAWKSVGIDRFDPDHMSEINNEIVPDMPCRLVGYAGDHIAEQNAFADYYEMIWGNGDEAEILMEMPVTMQGRVQTDVDYVRYGEPVSSSDGRVRPFIHKIGGLFNDVFPAWGNFSIGIQPEYTDNARYDSLWNWCTAAKGNSYCSFLDEWAFWQRLDCSNVDSGWIWIKLNSGRPINVSLPWASEDSIAWGFAPDNCPQHDNGQSLYIYGFGLNFGLPEGYHFLPMIYPIVQNYYASNEKDRDAYAQTVSVYPVPAVDKVNVVALDEIRKVEIYNMAGTLVKVIMMNDNILELDVTSFAPGTYIAKITTDKGVASKKLLVK